MGCSPQQKMQNNRKDDDMSLIQPCQAAPIIINEIQIKTSPFRKQYQLFPEQAEPNNPSYIFENQDQRLSIIQNYIYSNSSENVPLRLIEMIDNQYEETPEFDRVIEFNRLQKSRKRSTKTKTKVTMEMLESIF